MANDQSMTASRPSRTSRAGGFFQSLRLLVCNITDNVQLRVSNWRLRHYLPQSLNDLDEANRQNVLNNSEWVMTQLFDVARRMDNRLTPVQIMHASIDAVADAVALDQVRLDDITSESDLKARLLTNLSIYNLYESQQAEPAKPEDQPAPKLKKPLPECVLNAGNTEGFIREVIAETNTRVRREINSRSIKDPVEATRLVCDQTAEIVIRRFHSKQISDLADKMFKAHLPGAIEHAKRLNGDSPS